MRLSDHLSVVAAAAFLAQLIPPLVPPPPAKPPAGVKLGPAGGLEITRYPAEDG
jgi:hypothetical protein